MSDIFREVDEAVRADKASELWKKYGPYVLGLAGIVVLATAAHQLWRAWHQDQQLERSELYTAAVQLAAEEDTGAATLAFAELGEPDGSYGTLAALERARLLAESGERAEALAIWDKLSEASSSGPAIAGLAALFFVMHQIDDGDPAMLEAKLQPLLSTESGYRPLALEQMAALALRQGDTAAALQHYREITDNLAAPPQLRARAAQMVAVLEEEEGGEP